MWVGLLLIAPGLLAWAVAVLVASADVLSAIWLFALVLVLALAGRKARILVVLRGVA